MNLSLLLEELDLSELKQGLDQLDPATLKRLEQDIHRYAPFLPEQRSLIHKHKTTTTLSPCTHFTRYEQSTGAQEGKEWIKQGKVGVLILAGGLGSRLGTTLPKGMIPVAPLSGRTLFQILCDKIKAASDWAGVPIPTAIMTSTLNHAQTEQFFQKHHHFGLPLSLFQQHNLPYITPQGKWLYDHPGHIASGPDGNGHALHRFVASSLYEQWEKQGIEHLNVLFVDNPLANPVDPHFIGLALQTQADAVLKAVPRLHPQESMGVVAEDENGIRVIEYSELPSDPSPFTLSSIGIFCLKMSFLETLGPFPLHLAWKEITLPGHSTSQRLGKSEYFLFDLLHYTSKSALFVLPRALTYAPLKDKVGDRDLASVQQALLDYDREKYYRLTGHYPASPLELPPTFEDG